MKKEKKQIKILLAFYTFSLVISGFTAQIVPQGLKFLLQYVPIKCSIIYQWLYLLNNQCQSISEHFMYGFDWLAFAHYTIAISFWGVWTHPTRNRWVIDWAMIVSILILPFAFIMGYLRGIPFWWQLIDCSFGVLSLIPLIMIDRRIKLLSIEEAKEDNLTPKYI